MSELLPLFVDLAGRRVLLVGGGPVAAAKLGQLLAVRADVRVVAHDPDTLKKFIKVINEMYRNLREEIRPRTKYDSKFELQFEDPDKGVTGSRIGISGVVPGQEDKGRGDTFTRLHLTEIPFWKGDADTAATALCDAAKGGKVL